MVRSRSYRVEHVEAGATAELAVVRDVPAHHASLEPFVSALLLAGRGGVVRLVDAADGRTVATRRVRPYGGRRFFSPRRTPTRSAGAGE
jgi:hypothetical protein